MQRWTRIDTMLEVAMIFSKRATCNRNSVGALLARDNRIISTGYNGPPSGEPHCTHTDNDGPCIRSVHAESNVIAFAAKLGISSSGATLYTTISPCIVCARLLVNAGIKEIIYINEYRDREGIEYLIGAGKRVLQRSPEF